MNWYRNLKRQIEDAENAKRSSPVGAAHVVVKPRSESTERFVIMPRGLRARSSELGNFLATSLMPSSPKRLTLGLRKFSANVIQTVHEDGVKLAEMTPTAAKQLQAGDPRLLVVPEVFYEPAVNMLMPTRAPTAVRSKVAKKAGKATAKKTAKKAATASTSTSTSVTVTVTDGDGNPVPDAAVVAFSDVVNRIGIDGMTNASGRCKLNMDGFGPSIERLLVYPKSGFWSFMRADVSRAADIAVALKPLDLSFTDCLRHHYGTADLDAGTGVRVAVIDTGIALDHPDLRVKGGASTVENSDPTDYGPVGGDHGSHVAGIVAARGTTPAGVRGIAPGVELYSFRVFPPDGGASNFAIVAAIDAAVETGCDLINLSLGGGPRDLATEAAISDARRQGCVCVIAAGNDDRSRVSQPAAYNLALAVSAVGRKGTFPAGTADALDVKAPFGTDKNDFLAAFSNVGPEIDVAGPGVAVISTVPGGYASMSGTSMACPAVTGVAAALLARNKAVLNANRDADRSDAIKKLVFDACRKLGFAYDEEGQGMPFP